MEPFDRRISSERPLVGSRSAIPSAKEPRSSSLGRTPRAYWICDGVTAGIILFMVVFTPWAFGTTQEWAIWTMNISAYLLGAVLIGKWLIGRQTGYQPHRWDRSEEMVASELLGDTRPRRDPFVLALGILTVFILAYILVSILNARANYLEDQRRFEYRTCIKWLPHSYDSSSTWESLWMYLRTGVLLLGDSGLAFGQIRQGAAQVQGTAGRRGARRATIAGANDSSRTYAREANRA